MVNPTSSIIPSPLVSPSPAPQAETTSVGLAPALMTAAAVTAATAIVIGAALPPATRARVWQVAGTITGTIQDGGVGIVRSGVDRVANCISCICRCRREWNAHNAIEAHLKTAGEKYDRSNIIGSITGFSRDLTLHLQHGAFLQTSPAAKITLARQQIARANALIAGIRGLPAEIRAILEEARELLDPSFRLHASLIQMVNQIEQSATQAEVNIQAATAAVQPMTDITNLTEISFAIEKNLKETTQHNGNVSTKKGLFDTVHARTDLVLDAKLAELSRIRDAANTEATAAEAKALLARQAYNDKALPAFGTNQNSEIQSKLREMRAKVVDAQTLAARARELIPAMTTTINLLPHLEALKTQLASAQDLLAQAQAAKAITSTQRAKVLEEVTNAGRALSDNLAAAHREFDPIKAQYQEIARILGTQNIVGEAPKLLEDTNVTIRAISEIDRENGTAAQQQTDAIHSQISDLCTGVIKDFRVSKGHIDNAEVIYQVAFKPLVNILGQAQEFKRSADLVVAKIQTDKALPGESLRDKARRAAGDAEQATTHFALADINNNKVAPLLTFLPQFLSQHTEQVPKGNQLYHIRDHIDALTRETKAALDTARTLATEAARLADSEDLKEGQRATVRGAIQDWIQDLRNINPTTSSAFVSQYKSLYKEIANEIPQMIIEALRPRRQDIESEIRFFESGEATAATKAANIAAIEGCLSEIRVLRGNTGFSGPIDAKWRTFFAAKQQEILAGAAVCRSIKSTELDDAQRREILSIDPAQIAIPGQLGSLDALDQLITIGNRYKALISQEANSFADIAITADSALRATYDAQNAAQEAARREYDFENGKYNTLCGEGFNPDANINAEGICTVTKGTRIDQYQKQNVALVEEARKRAQFWQDVILRIKSTAPAAV